MDKREIVRGSGISIRTRKNLRLHDTILRRVY